jgi:hypothetical protein
MSASLFGWKVRPVTPNINSSTIRDNIGYVVGVGVLVASLSMNVAFAIKLREPARQTGRPGGIQMGDRLPVLNLIRQDGSRHALGFSRPTLLYVFSPTCQWCMRDHANLTAIQKASAGRFDLVAVTLNERSLPEYLASYPYSGVVGVIRESEVTEQVARDLKVTPQLVVVDTGGSVQETWTGALFDGRQREAELFFDVRLPGLRAANPDK